MIEGTEGYNAASRSIRVLGPHERSRFTPEAWGYLVGLNRAGLLEAVELEQVIERVMSHFEGRVAIGDLRMLLGDGSSEGEEPGAAVITH